jgi:hypothetical protein
MTFAQDIVTFLALQAVGVQSTTLFVDELPATVTHGLVVEDTPSREPEYTAGRAVPAYRHRSAQIRVRSNTKAAARTLIDAAWDAIAPVRNQSIGGTEYVKMTPVQEPFLLMMDANRKPVYAFNVDGECRA